VVERPSVGGWYYGQNSGVHDDEILGVKHLTPTEPVRQDDEYPECRRRRTQPIVPAKRAHGAGNNSSDQKTSQDHWAKRRVEPEDAADPVKAARGEVANVDDGDRTDREIHSGVAEHSDSDHRQPFRRGLPQPPTVSLVRCWMVGNVVNGAHLLSPTDVARRVHCAVNRLFVAPIPGNGIEGV